MKTAFFFFIFIALSFNASAQTLVVSVDEWCPYTCLDAEHSALNESNPGYYPEIIDAIFIPQGFEIVYTVRPWKRALAETRSGILNAILSPAREEAPDFIFPEEEIAHLCWCFYTKQSYAWEYDGIESLANKTVGYLEGNSFSPELDTYLREIKDITALSQPVHGLNFQKVNTEKLLRGRISTFIDEANSTRYYLFRHTLEDKIRKAGCLDCLNMYMAFSPAIKDSAKHAAIFTEGLRKLRESGKLKEILSHYGLADWKE